MNSKLNKTGFFRKIEQRLLRKSLFTGWAPSCRRIALRALRLTAPKQLVKTATELLKKNQHAQADLWADALLYKYPECDAALALKDSIAQDAVRADLWDALGDHTEASFEDALLTVLEHEGKQGAQWLSQSGLSLLSC
jgi:hypothetical protein